jgi:uncharacterized protein YbaP (TraB family)
MDITHSSIYDNKVRQSFYREESHYLYKPLTSGISPTRNLNSYYEKIIKTPRNTAWTDKSLSMLQRKSDARSGYFIEQL